MAWWLMGGAALFLAPCAGAAVVWGLLAFHEVRAGASRVGQRQRGRRASGASFDGYLLAGDHAEDPPRRPPILPEVLTRRADPSLLYQHLEARRPLMARRARPTPAATGPTARPTGRTARPTRLVPLTA